MQWYQTVTEKMWFYTHSFHASELEQVANLL